MPSPQGQNISLCVIAKDEEKWLPRSLASARPFVDQIVLVDTGSSDATVEIARSFQAEVYFHAWEKDFAKHRNQSMSYAKGDWILILDADEELDPKKAPNLPLVVDVQDCDSFFLELSHLGPDGVATQQWTPRLLRAAAGLRFEGRIHEHLTGGEGKALRAPVNIIHHGFALSPEIMAQKAKRNLELLKKWAQEEPENISAHTYLAQTLITWPETAGQALEAGLRALALAKEKGVSRRYLPRIYHPLLIALTHQKDYKTLIACAQECLALLPDYPDPLYSLSWAHLQMQNWDEVCRAARRFMVLQDRWQEHDLEYPYTQNLTLNLKEPVLERWVYAAGRMGQDAEANQVFERLLGERAAEQPALRAVSGLDRAGNQALARDLASLAVDRHPEWEWPRQYLTQIGGGSEA
jgi:glycosyltransferase involved in cell wall biosynthesis